ncbi:MAG TPA: hypothetical protein VLH85_05415 [Levilinea sp.]|nr:hypothetical protein [Levilinea sp.]
MDRIREQVNRPLVAAALGFVLGLIVGLPLLGWWLFPVEYYDAAAEHLRADLQRDWLRMSIDSYARNQNAALALQRWKELGPTAMDVFAEVIVDPSVDPEAAAIFANLVQAAPQQPEMQLTPTTAAEEAAEADAAGGMQLGWLVGLCLTLLVIGGVLIYVLLFRKRPDGISFSMARQSQASREPVQRTNFAAEGQEAPVAQFMTTYVLGEDLYDDSFSIDSPTGEFLGECGVGIADTIGVGDPKKVTAFEVWLFDKNDIQTITKVLMSQHAYNDPVISQRLMSKGEPVVVEAGQHVLLETATLQLEARVVDMNYGQGPLPANSNFERLTLELAIWPKNS